MERQPQGLDVLNWRCDPKKLVNPPSYPMSSCETSTPKRCTLKVASVAQERFRAGAKGLLKACAHDLECLSTFLEVWIDENRIRALHNRKT